MERFAVIDTETNWANEIMSIGTVIADADTFCAVDLKYHILTPEYLIGGMYDRVLQPRIPVASFCCSRGEMIHDLLGWFKEYDISTVFAYNAAFDHGLLPELNGFKWYDIMRLAAYRQYNAMIPESADCFRTGRLKRGYGVEPMFRLLSGDRTYYEIHNAIHDALDELEIMKMLGYKPSDYIPLEASERKSFAPKGERTGI